MEGKIHLITVEMEQKDNILQELKELNSNLADLARQNVYSIPDGYFDGLITELMKRIRAMEAVNAGEELFHLSPALNGLNKHLPFTVPSNYFDGLAERALAIARNADRSAKEELESLSPLLSGLKKDLPFTVPRGYFENLGQPVVVEENKPAAKLVSFSHRKWMRYAAAAVIAGLIAVGGFLYFTSVNRIDPVEQPYAWVKKSVKKIKPVDIDNFVDLVDETQTSQQDVAVNPPAAEIKELMKDVSDQEIQEFLQDTPDTETSVSDDETIVN